MDNLLISPVSNYFSDLKSVSDKHLEHLIYILLKHTGSKIQMFEHRSKTTPKSIPNEDSSVGDHFYFIETVTQSLVQKDYKIAIVLNPNGSLCTSYPQNLIIILQDKSKDSTNAPQLNPQKIATLVTHSRFARVRGRFPWPVIRFGKKTVARSATLSKPGGILYDKSRHTFKKTERPPRNPSDSKSPATEVSGLKCDSPPPTDQGLENQEPQIQDMTLKNYNMYNPWRSTPRKKSSLRKLDFELLSEIGVDHICNLMIRVRRHAWKIPICSSENVESTGIYSSLKRASIPTPGTNAVTEWEKARLQYLNSFKSCSTSDNTTHHTLSQTDPSLSSENSQIHSISEDSDSTTSSPPITVKFQWPPQTPWLQNDPIFSKQILSNIDFSSQIPPWYDIGVPYWEITKHESRMTPNWIDCESLKTKFSINPVEFRSWSLFQIAHFHLLYMLYTLSNPNTSGILVHCLSGWDRTPFFISLIRL